ncbi:hypothetical protein MKZ38_005662 [Zalerion maritima]|uniref:THO complex subunit 3 n=1 Tax=Zalerion maritima TaxID=339359 RepID=A0AAD5RXV1_9PEZI|nr:hypothetical protein MKZ38_005662 [Zalerion maritima]
MAPTSKSRAQPPYLTKDAFPKHFASSSIRQVTYSDPTAARISSQNSSIRSIAWNSASTLVATGGPDRTLRVWNPERNNVRNSTELKGHAAMIETVAFNPAKEGELCSVSPDGVAKFWDVRTRTCINEVKGLGGAFTLTWHSNGQSLVVGNKEDVLHVLSPSQPTPISSHPQGKQTNQIAFCWSGSKIFATTGPDGKTRILDYPSFDPKYRLNYFPEDDPRTEFTLNGHTSSCLSVALQPTGRYLATGGSDAVISLWDTADWICQRTITTIAGPVRSISFTHEGSYVAGGSEEGSGIEVHHVETGDLVHAFKTAGPSPIVSWAPTKYVLAYTDLSVLRTVGLESSQK